MAAAARVAVAEAQNAAYREAKILQTDSVIGFKAAWMLTQVQLALDLDLDRRELSGAALLTVVPSGAAPDAMAELVLDIHNLDVNAVSLPSEGLDELSFTVEPVGKDSQSGTVRIELPSPSPGWGWSTVVVKVDYRARDGSGVRWIEDGTNNESGGPLFFMGHGTACGFPYMGTSAIGATHSATLTVSVRSAVVANELKAIMYTTGDMARLHELVRRGLGQKGTSATNAVTALSTESGASTAVTAELEPEPEPEPEPAAGPVQRVFELHVSDPVPCSALSLAVGCLDRVAVRSDGADCGCEAPSPWCCCCCGEPCAGVVA